MKKLSNTENELKKSVAYKRKACECLKIIFVYFGHACRR